MTKRQKNGWMALGSFQMVKNKVWNGLSATPSSPNDEFFPLDQNWDWSGKLMGSYRAPYEITVSALYNFLAGVPRQRTFTFRNVPVVSTVTLPLEELGAQRDPAQHVVNLKAMRPIQLGGSRRLSLSFDVFNLFNVNTATTVRYVSSSTYGTISAILPPRVARIGVEVLRVPDRILSQHQIEQGETNEEGGWGNWGFNSAGEGFGVQVYEGEVDEG